VWLIHTGYYTELVKKDITIDQLTPGVYKKLSLQNFFSHDILDIKWLPKFSRRKKIDEVDYKKFNEFGKI
jgi:hypothetical protein